MILFHFDVHTLKCWNIFSFIKAIFYAEMLKVQFQRLSGIISATRSTASSDKKSILLDFCMHFHSSFIFHHYSVRDKQTAVRLYVLIAG